MIDNTVELNEILKELLLHLHYVENKYLDIIKNNYCQAELGIHFDSMQSEKNPRLHTSPTDPLEAITFEQTLY